MKRTEAKDIINFRQLSYLLTGSPTKIHSKFIPKEYKKTVEELYTLIEYWMQGEILVTEGEIKEVLDEFLIFARQKLNKTAK